MKVKTKYITNEKEWEKIQASTDKYKAVQMKQQKEGYFKVESPLPALPLEVIDEILKELHNIYANKAFDEAFEDLDENHRMFTAAMITKYKFQKFLALFWFTCFMAAICYILMGGR